MKSEDLGGARGTHDRHVKWHKFNSGKHEGTRISERDCTA